MKRSNRRLEELFSAVETDTPTFDRDELLRLLDKRSSAPVVMSPLQTPVTIRKHGSNKKGIITMSISAILLTACLFIFTLGDKPATNHSANLAVKTPLPQRTELPVAKTSPRQEERKTNTSLNDTGIKYLGFDQIDLSCVNPVRISGDDMKKMGIVTQANGDIILYHAMKVGFPMNDPTKTYDNYTEEEAKPYRQILFHPSYATDSRGDLLMRYHYTKHDSSEITNVEFGDHESDFNKILNSNYLSENSSASTEKAFDPATNIILKQYHIRVGIMTCDTMLSWNRSKNDDSAFLKTIENDLRAKDSLYKAQFGGEKGMRVRFQFPSDYSKLTPFEKIVKDSLDAISKMDFPKRQNMFEAQMQYLYALGEAKIPDTVKLIIHELSIKMGYEGYVLLHAEQEQELANITSLIPIQMREYSGLKTDGKYDNGLILWYEPSKELFKALPQLQRTLSAEACQSVSDKKLQNVSLYPNPASMYLFLNFTLAAPATISVSILDLSGKTIAENILSHHENSGINKESITLGDIPPGVYIVQITTDSGERSIQRVVITK